MRLWTEVKDIAAGNVNLSDLMDPSRAGARVRQALLLIRELWRSIRRDDAMNMAASLAFKTLLALVPVLAISLAVVATLDAGAAPNPPVEAENVSDGTDLTVPGQTPQGSSPLAASGEQRTYTDEFIEAIRSRMPDFPGIDNVVDSVRSFADNARAIYSIGFIFLFMTAFSLLNSIEFAFNKIWQVSASRSYLSKLTAFLTTLVIVPVLMVLSVLLMSQIQKSAETVFSSGEAQAVSQEGVAPAVTPDVTVVETEEAGWNDLLIQVVLAGSSLFVTCIALTALLYLMPNTPVRLRAALAGGFVSGVAFELAKYGFRYYALRLVHNYTQVYGSLLAVPLFLVWVWLVWVIVLLGVEVAFALQNFRDLAVRAELENKGISNRVYLAARLVLRACRYFRAGEKPAEYVEKAAEELQVPPYVLRKILAVLLEKNIMRRVAPDEESYVPAKDIHLLNVNEVLRAIQADPVDVPPGPGDVMQQYFQELFAGVDEAHARLLEHVTFADLVMQEDALAARPEEVEETEDAADDTHLD